MDETKDIKEMLTFATTEEELKHAITQGLYIIKKYTMLALIFLVIGIFFIPVSGIFSINAMIWAVFIFTVTMIMFMSAIVIQYIGISSYKTRLFILKNKNKK